MRFLFDRQQRLFNYQLSADFCILFKSQPIPSAQVTSLQLCFQNQDDCDKASRLLKNTPQLKHLEVQVDRRSLRGPEQLEIMSAAILKAIQSGNASHDHCRLESLRFVKLDFGTCQSVDKVFHRLKHLQLIGCLNTEDLLAKLAKLSLDLNSFCTDDRNCETICEVYPEEFLRSLRSPKSISLDLDPMFNLSDTPLHWSSIQPYASTIETLRIRHGYEEFSIVDVSKDASGFGQFCKSATQLQQLAISGVHLHIGREEQDQLSQVLVSIYHYSASASIGH